MKPGEAWKRQNGKVPLVLSGKRRKWVSGGRGKVGLGKAPKTGGAAGTKSKPLSNPHPCWLFIRGLRFSEVCDWGFPGLWCSSDFVGGS